mgnify:CR=1 FL=1
MIGDWEWMVVVTIVREFYVQQRKKTGKSSAAEKNTEVRVRERERETEGRLTWFLCTKESSAAAEKN